MPASSFVKTSLTKMIFGGLLAGLSVSPALAQSAAGCATVSANGATLERAEMDVRQTARALQQIDEQMVMRDCGGSVTVYYGNAGDVCAAMADEVSRLEYDLRDAISRRDALQREARTQTVATASDCAPDSVGENIRSAHSQFRTPASQPSRQTAEFQQPRDGVIAPDIGGSDEVNGSIQEIATASQPAAQATRQAASEPQPIDPNRRVRAVGPAFFPDQSEAIDLQSPVPTVFR